MRATVITDASFCPRTGAGGWAAWIRFDDKRLVKRSGAFRDLAKHSTDAEFKAAVNGVLHAAAGGATTVLLQSDNQQVVQQFAQMVNAAGVPIPCVVKTRHVKGHDGGHTTRSWVNEWCDREAKVHMRAMRARLETTHHAPGT
jgi:ribonuclease HI